MASKIAFQAAVFMLGLGCATGRPSENGVVAHDQRAMECESGAGPNPGVPGGLPEVSPTALAAHIRFLADDALRGRGTGTPGFELAARYVAACLADFGLVPAGTKGYMQPVPLRRSRTVEGSTLILNGSTEHRELVLNRDYVSAPDLLRTRLEISAPVVFVGFGVTATERGYDDYRDVDAKGKIVVLLMGAPRSFPPTERAHYASPRVKSANAVQHGAVGILIVRTRDQTAPWERVVRQWKTGAMAWLNPDGEPQNVFPALRGVARLSDSSASALFDGAPRSYDEVITAAEQGLPMAFDLPIKAMIRTVSTHERLESPNIAGLLHGSDARLRDEVVVLTAHLDHLGVGEPVKGDSIYNGALDNASGSAALLEVARAFTRLPQPPRRSVLFLAVTAEEEGLLGSDYFAEYPTVPSRDIVANINLDGLAILYPLRELVPMGAAHSTIGEAVERAASKMGIELGPDPFPQEVFFVRSDQYSFVRRGVPSLFLFMGAKSDSGIDALARFSEWSRTRYHTPQDDVGQPMDLDAGARHAQLNFLVGLEVANADEKPAWKAGDFFGRTFGRRRTSQ